MTASDPAETKDKERTETTPAEEAQQGINCLQVLTNYPCVGVVLKTINYFTSTWIIQVYRTDYRLLMIHN